MSESTEQDLYWVVINHEEQYSIWVAGDSSSVPNGWRIVGEPAPKESCLDRIEELWTDMRPLSLRQAMQDNNS